MVEIKNDKIERVISIYRKLMNGYLIIKAKEAKNFGVNESKYPKGRFLILGLFWTDRAKKNIF